MDRNPAPIEKVWRGRPFQCHKVTSAEAPTVQRRARKRRTFKDIKKKIVDDPRYNKFSSSDKKCEKEFNNWVSSKI